MINKIQWNSGVTETINTLLDYEIGENSHFATIQMLTESNKRFTKTIVLNEDILDLQFFPESGEMVHGLQSRIGFKVLGCQWSGKDDRR